MTRYSHSSVRETMPRFFTLEMASFTVTMLSLLVLIWCLVMHTDLWFIVVAVLIFAISLVMVVRLCLDPDWIRARQTDSMLKVATLAFDYMDDGLTPIAAKNICKALLPTTAACAVAITDTSSILAYEGYMAKENPTGCPIKTAGTHAALRDDQMQVLYSSEDIGLPENASIRAAIIVPLHVGHKVVGVLKFYYRRPHQISETQKSIAQGFGRLLSTQMAATALEEQEQLATSMELKMLQSQINPHFLFNTINTIASLVRTDPEKARILLREFAVFYRRTLENSEDLIMLSREIEQTQRYFMFEIARFGEDRVALEIDVDEPMLDILVPAFILQPLVENAVHHAMRAEGKLTVTVAAKQIGDMVCVEVKDDGVGMDETTCAQILHPDSSRGMGIAVKNVHDRIIGFFDEGTEMDVTSEQGSGTTVTLKLKGVQGIQPVSPQTVDDKGILVLPDEVHAVVFDLDGTLLDTLPDLVVLTNTTLDEFGMPLRSEEEILSFVGNGGRVLIEKAVPENTSEKQIDEIYKRWQELYSELGNSLTKPYPDMIATLQELKARGLKLGVLSNKFDGAVQDCVAEYLPDLFDAAFGESEAIPRKPDPSGLETCMQTIGVTAAETIYVGDSPTDVMTAHNAHAFPVAVAWGYHQVEDFDEVQPYVLVRECKDLLKLLPED